VTPGCGPSRKAVPGRTRPVEGSRTSFDTLDDSQVEVFAGRLLLSVDLLRDRAGYIVFNDRHYLQFQEIGPLGINLRERGLGTFNEVETSA